MNCTRERKARLSKGCTLKEENDLLALYDLLCGSYESKKGRLSEEENNKVSMSIIQEKKG